MTNQEKFKNWFFKYERRLSSGALLFGFILDNLTLTRIDLFYDNLVLILYLFVAGASILFLHIIETKNLTGKVFSNIKHTLPISMQFAFGGLFSGFAIFYTRSASLIESWPFLLLLVALLIGNEFLRERYGRFTFQISIYFFAVFSFMIFFVPTLLGKMGPLVFLLSGAVSLVLIWGFVRALDAVIHEKVQKSKKYLIASTGSIFIAINVLYFTNIIPPIPLSLKDVQVAHLVERVGIESYKVVTEEQNFFEALNPTKTVHIQKGKSVYMYSAIFAPTDLDTKIFHSWEYYDTVLNKWVKTDRIGFAIVGGRDGGYRGYSVKSSLVEGKWRVRVVTGRDQTLGRIEFEVKFIDDATKLEENII